ncbi:hypothetical protein BGX27_002265, partial [Mortierella sp. AM989]
MSTNRISPESSIPATTCIKISLQPVPKFNSIGTKASLEYPATLSGRTVVVKFIFPISATSPIPEIVEVTGTFNAWQRTQPLTRNIEASRFEGDISISLDNLQSQEGNPTNKVLYKFVLDRSNWVTDPYQQVDRDQAGNLNNVLFVDTAASSRSSVEGHQYTRDGSVSTPVNGELVNEDDDDEDDEMERLARLKKEAEDGGMWGGPEHFSEGSSQTLTNGTPSEKSSIRTPEPVSEGTSEVKAEQQDTQTKIESEDEDEDDRIIRELGGSIRHTPYFKANDSAELTEHITEVLGASNPDVEVSIAHKIDDTVTKITEELEPAAPATATDVTMTGTETTTSIQGEVEVATTAVEDTITFTDGPE